MKNFLPLRREIQDHWIYSDSQYLHLWLDFLFNARYSEEPKTDVYKGVIYTINRGEFIFSRPSYAKRLNVSESRVRKCMELLVKDGMIEQVGSLGKNKPTIYKIINYDLYNNPPSETVGAQGVDGFSTKSPPSDNQVDAKSQPLKKKEKKEKIEKDYTTEIKNFLSRYQSISNFRELNKQYWDVIRETRKNGKVSVSIIHNNMKKWEKYDPVVVQYALKSHIEAHGGKKEEYTIGIMRGNTKEEAEDKLNRLANKKVNVGTHQKDNVIRYKPLDLEDL
jgi:DNA-binding Lrp family transcriptional regulator